MTTKISESLARRILDPGPDGTYPNANNLLSAFDTSLTWTFADGTRTKWVFLRDKVDSEHPMGPIVGMRREHQCDETAHNAKAKVPNAHLCQCRHHNGPNDFGFTFNETYVKPPRREDATRDAKRKRHNDTFYPAPSFDTTEEGGHRFWNERAGLGRPDRFEQPELVRRVSVKVDHRKCGYVANAAAMNRFKREQKVGDLTLEEWESRIPTPSTADGAKYALFVAYVLKDLRRVIDI
jgi:hypothetical protein